MNRFINSGGIFPTTAFMLMNGHQLTKMKTKKPGESLTQFRRTQEGCGGLRGENPAAFPKARPIFQQPFSLPESAQTLAGIAFRAARKSARNFPAASKFARKLVQQGISDSHSLLEFLINIFYYLTCLALTRSENQKILEDEAAKLTFPTLKLVAASPVKGTP